MLLSQKCSIKKQLLNQQFKDRKQNTLEFQRKIMCYVSEMEVEEQSFIIAHHLISFYQFPFLLSLNDFYQKIHQEFNLSKYFDQMIKIQLLSQQITNHSLRSFYQLDFLKFETKEYHKRLKNTLRNHKITTFQFDIKLMHFISAFNFSLKELIQIIKADDENDNVCNHQSVNILKKMFKDLQKLYKEEKQELNLFERFYLDYKKNQAKKICRSLYQKSNNKRFKSEIEAIKILFSSLHFENQKDVSNTSEQSSINSIKNEAKSQSRSRSGSKDQIITINSSRSRSSSSSKDDNDDKSINQRYVTKNIFQDFKKSQEAEKYSSNNEKGCYSQAQKLYKNQKFAIENRGEYQYYERTVQNLQQIKYIDHRMSPIVSSQKGNLCCRTFFFEREEIDQQETISLEYKHYVFPFVTIQQQILKKTITGFLNHQGGIILIGIHENDDTKQKMVLGLHLTEFIKEQFLKSIRSICQSIQPDIVTDPYYSIKFVPIKHVKSYQYVPGKYVAKIIIQSGRSNQVYTFKNGLGEYFFANRTENQVLVKEIRFQFAKIKEIIKDRILNPKQKTFFLHQGNCPEPEKGINLYTETLLKKNKKNIQATQKPEIQRTEPNRDQFQISQRSNYHSNSKINTDRKESPQNKRNRNKKSKSTNAKINGQQLPGRKKAIQQKKQNSRSNGSTSSQIKLNKKSENTNKYPVGSQNFQIDKQTNLKQAKKYESIASGNQRYGFDSSKNQKPRMYVLIEGIKIERLRELIKNKFVQFRDFFSRKDKFFIFVKSTLDKQGQIFKRLIMENDSKVNIPTLFLKFAEECNKMMVTLLVQEYQAIYDKNQNMFKFKSIEKCIEAYMEMSEKGISVKFDEI